MPRARSPNAWRRCDAVVGVGTSEGTVRRARARLATVPGVAIEHRTPHFDGPSGDFDLVVCSDVLYIWATDALESGLARVARQLRPGGRIMLSYLGELASPISGADVDEIAARRLPCSGSGTSTTRSGLTLVRAMPAIATTAGTTRRLTESLSRDLVCGGKRRCTDPRN